MKKPSLLFTLKCSIILYFAACTGINDYTNSVAATPLVTKGTWKAILYTNTGKEQTRELAGYSLTFDPSGKITAQKKDEVITGNWSEDEIQKRITINLNTNNPALEKLNNYWDISTITKASIQLKDIENPTGGRLQITSL